MGTGCYLPCTSSRTPTKGVGVRSGRVCASAAAGLGPPASPTPPPCPPTSLAGMRPAVPWSPAPVSLPARRKGRCPCPLCRTSWPSISTPSSAPLPHRWWPTLTAHSSPRSRAPPSRPCSPRCTDTSSVCGGAVYPCPPLAVSAPAPPPYLARHWLCLPPTATASACRG